MITSSTAPLIASVIAWKSSISYEGVPSGVRAWMWIMVAPSSTARLASAAYSSGVYGIAGHCSRFATAPEIEHVTIAGSSNRLMSPPPRLAPPDEVPLEHQVDAHHGVAVDARVALARRGPVADRGRRAGDDVADVVADLQRQRSGADRAERHAVRRVDAEADPLVAHVEHLDVDLLLRGGVRLGPERPADEARGAAGVGAGQVAAGGRVDPARPGQDRQPQLGRMRARAHLDRGDATGARRDERGPVREQVAAVAVRARGLVGRRQLHAAERREDDRRLAAVVRVRLAAHQAAVPLR